MSRRRIYVVSCPVCHQWAGVPTLELQAIYREAGACPACLKDGFFMLKVRIAAIEMMLERIAKRGAALPEDDRPALRCLYARKARQLTACQKQLADLEQVEVSA